MLNTIEMYYRTRAQLTLASYASCISMQQDASYAGIDRRAEPQLRQVHQAQRRVIDQLPSRSYLNRPKTKQAACFDLLSGATILKMAT